MLFTKELEADARPMVVPCMMMPSFASDAQEGTTAGNGLVWVYAYNAGGLKAHDVRIRTNIPQDRVQCDAWADGALSSRIEELEPDLPICIGVVRMERSGAEALWIHFDYTGEDHVDYSEQCEIDIWGPN